MSEELKPCPFCGGEAKTKHYDDNSSLIIYCPTCNKDLDLAGESPGERWAADFEFAGWSEEDDDAVIAAWNRRPAAKELVANIIIDEEQLQRMCDEAVSTIIDCAGLLAVADECDAAGMDTDWAQRIREAVGA